MMAIPKLTTDRLILRAPTPEDVPPFARFYASDRAAYVGGPLPDYAVWRYLAEVIGHWSLRGFGRWICARRDSGDTVGLVGLHHPPDWPEAELGWMIFDGHAGQGFGTEAALAARDHAYRTLGWSTMISLIDPANIPSVALAEKIGARRERDYTHPKYGAMAIWRHPSAAQVAA